MKFFTGCWYSDNAIMFQYIDEIEVKSGSDRNKILYVNPRKGGSNLYGYTWKGFMSPTKSRQKVDGYNGLYITEMRRKNPEFAEIAKEFRDLHFPDFKYSQIQINKNYRIPKHKDSTNVGISTLCCFGDYTGGMTCINHDGIIIRADAREKPITFNGSELEHWVEEFEGDRYSLVYFHNLKNKDELLI